MAELSSCDGVKRDLGMGMRKHDFPGMITACGSTPHLFSFPLYFQFSLLGFPCLQGILASLPKNDRNLLDRLYALSM